MTTPPNESITEKFARLKAEREAKAKAEGRTTLFSQEAKKPPVLPIDPGSFDEDLIPDTGVEQYEFEADIDRTVRSIGIIDAYKRWAGGEIEDPGGRSEGIMCQCPLPGHADKKPSAWVNTDKDTWYCGGCGEGGDVYDLAANHYGIDYKAGSLGTEFHDLRRAIMGEFGHTFAKVGGRWVMDPDDDTEWDLPDAEPVAVTQPEPEPVVQPAPEPEPAPEPVKLEAVPDLEESNVVEMKPDEPDEDPNEADFVAGQPLNWREIVEPGTFLYEFTNTCSTDDLPEEYHFWHGMLGVGLVMGRDVAMVDAKPVMGNIFLCVLGKSGDGKSRSKSYLDELLWDTMDFVEGDETNKGVKIIKAPASGEALIDEFRNPVEEEPINPKLPPKITYIGRVRGLIDFNEFSALVGRAKRMGNTLPSTLMEFYDGDRIISTTSRGSSRLEARDSFASATTTAQPAVIGALLDKGDADSGFVNRWIFATGKAKKRVAINRHRVDITPSKPAFYDIKGWASVPRLIDWDPVAEARFTAFFDTQIMPLKDGDEDSVLARIDLTMKKLVLLFAANRLDEVISVKAVEQAMACWDYIISCYSIVSSKIGNTDANEMSLAIQEYVKKHHEESVAAAKKAKGKPAPVGATKRQVFRSLARRKWDPDKLSRMFDSLEKMGVIQLVPPPAGVVVRTERYGVAR